MKEVIIQMRYGEDSYNLSCLHGSVFRGETFLRREEAPILAGCAGDYNTSMCVKCNMNVWEDSTLPALDFSLSCRTEKKISAYHHKLS
jgi:hypothetical protein